MKNKDYNKHLRSLQAELVTMKEWVVDSGSKVVIVFEGRDTAGKGGVIKALTDRVSPRVFRVVALPAPNDRERSQMYLQRYLTQLPAGGEVIIFDRSWYNRAGVEKVFGFATERQVADFLRSIPVTEKAVVDSGIILLKYWLEVSPQQQTQRLQSRIDDPRKIWKLSDMDIASYTRWDDYTKARDDMFLFTSTDHAPWHVVPADDKNRARLNVIRHILDQIPYQQPERDRPELPVRDDASLDLGSDHSELEIPQPY